MIIETLKNYSNLNDTEINVLKSIETRILNNKNYTIREIARSNYVSTSTIFKLTKKLGFLGYSEMIFFLKSSLTSKSTSSSPNSLQNIINDYSNDTIQLFINFLNYPEQQRISLLGLGYSEIICDYISRKLSLYDFFVYNGAHLDVHTKLPNSKPVNLLIVISKSGETEDVLRNIKIARNSNIKIVSFTSNMESTIARYSNLSFEINCNSNSRSTFEADTFFALTILAFEYILQLYIEQKNLSSSISL